MVQPAATGSCSQGPVAVFVDAGTVFGVGIGYCDWPLGRFVSL